MDTWYVEWQEWEGSGLPKDFTNSAVYYSIGEVDMDSTNALKALSKAMKEDGVVDSVSEALDLLENAVVTHGTMVEVRGELQPFFGYEDDIEDEISYTATWVEVNLDG